MSEPKASQLNKDERANLLVLLFGEMCLISGQGVDSKELRGFRMGVSAAATLFIQEPALMRRFMEICVWPEYMAFPEEVAEEWLPIIQEALTQAEQEAAST